MTKSILVIGGFSDIGLSTARIFAQNGYNIQLALRNKNRHENIIDDFKIRYNSNVTIYNFNVIETGTHKKFIENLNCFPDIVLCSVGFMGVQKDNEKNNELRQLVIKTNYEGPVNILSEFANLYEKQGFGSIVGISSVAGERGRASNYIYGSSKSGFTSFLSGLRNRLSKNNVQVLTVLPGPVRTKMTEGHKLPKFITTTPEIVAKSIYNGVIKRKDIIYVTPIWKLIMIIIKFIPEKIFKNKNL